MTTTQSTDAPEGPDAAKVAAIGGAVLGLLLSIGALAFFGTRAGLSVAAGATIAVANLVTMSAIIRAVLRPADADVAGGGDGEAAPTTDAAEADPEAGAEPAVDHAREGKRGGAAWGAFALLKIVVLFGGIYLLLTKHMVDPIPLVVGYGVLPLGIACSSLFTSLAPRPRRPSRAGRRNTSK
jgi:hypothetical protein